MAARVVTAIASTNPVTFFATLSTRGWCGVGLCAVLTYWNWISTLSRRPKDRPCPEFGRVLRVLYGLFSTRLAEAVLGFFVHTKPGELQAEQHGAHTHRLHAHAVPAHRDAPLHCLSRARTPQVAPSRRWSGRPSDRSPRRGYRPPRARSGQSCASRSSLFSARSWAATTPTSSGTRRTRSAGRSSSTPPTRSPFTTPPKPGAWTCRCSCARTGTLTTRAATAR